MFPFAEGSIQDVNLSSTYSYYMIEGLRPGTEYTVTINPIFGDVEGPVVSRKAVTGECPAAGARASPSRHRQGSGCAGSTELVSLVVTTLPVIWCRKQSGASQLSGAT